jgi:hypothetical protein
MRALRGIGKFIWRFMVVFSFIVNLVLVVVLIAAGIFIFEIKNNVADPLVQGLHSTAMGLDQATIDWTIPVRDTLGIDLQVPINANTITSQVTEINGEAVEPIAGETVVTLTRPVPIVITGAFINSNDLTLRNATVNITLPPGTQLPVALDLEVGLQTDIPVELDVRAVIPLSQTQLADPIRTLALLFEPLAIGLHNLPSDFAQAGGLVTAVLQGEAIDLLATDGTGFSDEAYDPWVGFSRTAGLNYDLFDQPVPPENVPMMTGLTVPGGIPFLDEQLPDRTNIYAQGGVNDVNAQAIQNLQAQGIAPYFYDGSMSQYFQQIQATVPQPPADTTTGTSDGQGGADASGQSETSGDNGASDLGIIPPPNN